MSDSLEFIITIGTNDYFKLVYRCSQPFYDKYTYVPKPLLRTDTHVNRPVIIKIMLSISIGHQQLGKA